MNLIEAYDLLRFSEQFQSRLSRVQEDLAGRRGLKREKDWLAAAIELLRAEREPAASPLERARGLPELADLAEEAGAELQGQWVDALEKLHAGITFHASSRAPLIEALFPHVKFAGLRRANREAAKAYVSELERRLKSGYVTRMLGQEEYAFARPVLEQIASAQARWQAALAAPGLAEEEAAGLRQELVGLAKKVDLALRQARLLAEAALTPVAGAFEAAALNARPKKRTAKPAAAKPEEAKDETPADAKDNEAPQASPAKPVKTAKAAKTTPAAHKKAVPVLKKAKRTARA